MDIYERYRNFVKDTVKNGDLSKFKSNPNYRYMLEHVSEAQGNEYIACIQNEFPEIPMDVIFAYIHKNDAQGDPSKFRFKWNKWNPRKINCSPTSLRYVYQALMILKHYKSTGLKRMVELGCGYGGLFLAIDHFAKHLNIEIEMYHMIDFEDVTHLIHKYLSRFDAHQFPETPLKIQTHNCERFGLDIDDTDLFFISNYAFTEIGKDKMMKYKICLFPKVMHGFITYQTSYDVSLDDVASFLNPLNIELERPQTANPQKPNYFVSF